MHNHIIWFKCNQIKSNQIKCNLSQQMGVLMQKLLKMNLPPFGYLYALFLTGLVVCTCTLDDQGAGRRLGSPLFKRWTLTKWTVLTSDSELISCWELCPAALSVYHLSSANEFLWGGVFYLLLYFQWQQYTQQRKIPLEYNIENLILQCKSC